MKKAETGLVSMPAVILNKYWFLTRLILFVNFIIAVGNIVDSSWNLPSKPA